MEKQEFHKGNSKRLSEAVQDFQLSMVHALRTDITEQLRKRAEEEAGVLPPLEPHEMFDYLMDTDSEFLNWLFPYCPIILEPGKMGYLHSSIVSQYRASIQPKKAEENHVQTEP